MGLDARLAAVASLVPEGARAADVGSDHAYLAMALLRDRGALRVIATDKNPGPCEAARRTLAAAGLTEEIAVRQGDGLAPLSPGEVDEVCIAGMGGGLINTILSDSPKIVASLSRLVLQPMNDAAEVRRWLYEHRWHVAAERLAEADGRLYEIIAAEPGEEPVPETWLLILGPVLWRERPPLFSRHAAYHISRLRRILTGMEKSEAAKKTEAYRQTAGLLRELEEKSQ